MIRLILNTLNFCKKMLISNTLIFLITGAIQIILRVFDILEYLLDMHDKRNCISDEDKYAKIDNNNIDIVQHLDSIIGLPVDEEATIDGTDSVSFTAAQTNLQLDQSDGVVTFDQVISNEGCGFDSNNGKFSCPVPGVYVFFFSSTKCSDQVSILLVQDDLFMDTTVCGKKGDQISHMGFLRLKKDDQVWLKYAKDVLVEKKALKFTTFSGFLLYEY